MTCVRARERFTESLWSGGVYFMIPSISIWYLQKITWKVRKTSDDLKTKTNRDIFQIKITLQIRDSEREEVRSETLGVAVQAWWDRKAVVVLHTLLLPLYGRAILLMYILESESSYEIKEKDKEERRQFLGIVNEKCQKYSQTSKSSIWRFQIVENHLRAIIRSNIWWVATKKRCHSPKHITFES